MGQQPNTEAPIGAVPLDCDVRGWQPIETAPKNETRVLIADHRGVIDVAEYIERIEEKSVFVRKAKDGDVYRIEKEDCGFWDSDIIYEPTHWMPLPKYPND